MSERRTIDVSHLPPQAFGVRDPVIWGVVLLMAIEGTAFALLAVAWLYVRGNLDKWTPTTVGPQAQTIEAIVCGVLLLSGVFELLVLRATHRHRLRGMRWWTVAAAAGGAVAVALRLYEIPRLQFRWDSDAAGSVFWGILVMHIAHAIFGTLENTVFAVLLFKGPIEKKHLSDLETNGVYWLFVVVSWMFLYPLLYLERIFLPK